MNELNPYTAPNPQPVDDPPLIAQLSTDVDGMAVEFEQTLDDILALNYHVNRALAHQHPKWMWFFFGGFAILMLSLTVGLAVTPGLADLALVSLAGAVLSGLGLALLAGLPWLNRWLVRRAVLKLTGQARNLNLIGLRRVTITPQFLIWASPVTQAISRWIGVEKIVVENDCLFIFVSTMSAYVLPRRAFNSEQHFREYALLAEKYRQQGGA